MRNIEKSSVRLFQAAFISLMIVLPGCTWFASHYDANAYQYFTSLKAFHIKFLEDNKATSENAFNEGKVRLACDSGDLRFREASEYASGKQDGTRVRAISHLHNVFQRNCQVALRGKKLFGIAFADEQIKDLKENYGFAIEGETDRVGSTTK